MSELATAVERKVFLKLGRGRSNPSGPAPPSALGFARGSLLRLAAEVSSEVPAASCLRKGSELGEQEGKA